MSDPRDAFIHRVTGGCSFADVGGLWMTVNEKVSVAARAGATRLAMLDLSPPESPWWPPFRDRMASMGIDAVAERSVDIAAYRDEPFDVVHCSGVLYHHPNPITVLTGLRRATRRHLVLTSAVTQSVISNECGTCTVPRSGAIFIPALDDTERRVLACHWQRLGGGMQGITEVASHRIGADNTFDAGPWWWLPTSRCLTAMAEAAGFRLLDEAPTWGGNAHVALLECA